MSSDTEPVLPSRPLVLEMLRAERDEQRGHSDSLDQRAGLVLGFAGVLVTLSNDIGQPWRALGAAASMASAVFALAAFWPRSHPVLRNLRQYLSATRDRTELVLVDTIDAANERGERLAMVKARRLQVALSTLAAAVAMLGVGVIVH